MNARTITLTSALAVLAGLAAGLGVRRCGADAGALGAAALAETDAILAFGPRPPGSAALDEVRAHLAARLAESGWAARAQQFERGTPVGRRRFVNLRARFGDPGDAATWERPVELLLGCHIDSKVISGIEFLGADDAASAAGAIVVIARHLAESRRVGLARRLELVFFDGEEAFGRDMSPTDGLYGSRHYARQLRGWESLPRFGIILDMIGHRDLSIRIPPDTPELLRRELFEAAREVGTARYFGTAAGPILDDHVPLNQAGVPTVDIIGDFTRGNWWHTTRDNRHLLSAASLDISIRTTLRLIERLLES